MIYVRTTNYGLGFITHAEALDLNPSEIEPGIWRIKETSAAPDWIQKVAGEVIKDYQPSSQAQNTTAGNFL